MLLRLLAMPEVVIRHSVYSRRRARRQRGRLSSPDARSACTCRTRAAPGTISPCTTARPPGRTRRRAWTIRLCSQLEGGLVIRHVLGRIRLEINEKIF